MAILVFLLIIITLVVWLLALVKYGNVGKANVGFKRLAKCFGVCLLIFIAALLLSLLDDTPSVYGNMTTVFFGLLAIGIDIIIILIWGIIAYQDANKLLTQSASTNSSGSDDILDDITLQ